MEIQNISFLSLKRETHNFIKTLDIKDKERNSLIHCAVENSDITQGVNFETMKGFVFELIGLKNLTTLKKALSGGVRFNFALGDCPAVFSVKYKDAILSRKEIIFSQNTNGDCSCVSLSHELGHAFDFEQEGLTSNLEFDVIKDEEGNYTKSQDYMPNSSSFALVKDKNGVYVLKELKEIEHGASFSKEFEDAFLKDYIHILDTEQSEGKKEGSTFEELLSDWDIESGFGYFLGAKKGVAEIADSAKLKKELFAQLTALATNGYTNCPGFDEKAPLYFPNTFEFVNQLIKKTL